MKLKLVGVEEAEKNELNVRISQNDYGEILIEAGGDNGTAWSLLTLRVNDDDELYVRLWSSIDDPDIKTDSEGCIYVESDVD